ncbi:MAG: DUF327 family protein [Brevinematia bacterium]
MRVEFRNISAKIPSKKTALKKENITFSDVLKAMEEDETLQIKDVEIENLSHEDIQSLANLIEKLGNDLSENPTLENLYSYKKAIKLLMEMLKRNFETKETISRVSFSKQKLYKTIEVIDENISKIGELILAQEKNRISYLKLVNNIKGLIVDLIL